MPATDLTSGAIAGMLIIIPGWGTLFDAILLSWPMCKYREPEEIYGKDTLHNQQLA